MKVKDAENSQVGTRLNFKCADLCIKGGLFLKRREMSYCDYGMTEGQVKALKDRCKRLDEDGHIALLRCAFVANRAIAPALYYSLSSGASYDRLYAISPIPLSRVDFYAYQRYCLYLFQQSAREN